jgi:serine phosphatase RsbU (regulator of sigma subunit)
MKKIGLIVIAIICYTGGFSQNLKDTTKIDELTGKGQSIYLNKPDSAIIYWKKALGLNNHVLGQELAPEIYERLLITKSDLLFNLSQVYREKGEIHIALEYIKDALKIDEMLGNKSNMSSSYNDLGILYYDLGLFESSLEYYLKSLELDKELDNLQGIATSLVNIGFLHSELKNYDDAIKCFKESRDIQLANNDSLGLITSYNNLSGVYYSKNELDSSLFQLSMSLPIALKINNEPSIANIWARKGRIFQKLKADSAMFYYQKALKTRIKVQDMDGLQASYYEMADYFLERNELRSALEHGEKAYLIAKQLENPKLIKTTSKVLSDIHFRLGSYKKAYQMLEINNKLVVEANNNENSRKLFKRHVDLEYKLKRENDSIISQAEIDKHNLELDKQKLYAEKSRIEKEKSEAIASKKGVYLIFAIIGLILLGAGLLYLIKINRQKQRAKEIIEEQKAIVEIKNREIVDSINYAKQLQKAILPAKQDLQSSLKEYFLMYKPKDIVAGDFYWMEKISDDEVLIAVADCTGHGVPGAMVSVVCSNALTKAAIEEKIQTPAKILDRARDIVIQQFGQNSNSQLKDGMDISLCRINTKDKTLSWAGAYNPLVVIRNDHQSMELLKADKMPVGGGQILEPYSDHSLKLAKGDLLYMYTDGYADQFGGTESNGKTTGKKYKSKRLHQFLLKIASLPMKEQNDSLHDEFFQWKGDLEQIDDVCLMGIKL